MDKGKVSQFEEENRMELAERIDKVRESTEEMSSATEVVIESHEEED